MTRTTGNGTRLPSSGNEIWIFSFYVSPDLYFTGRPPPLYAVLKTQNSLFSLFLAYDTFVQWLHIITHQLVRFHHFVILPIGDGLLKIWILFPTVMSVHLNELPILPQELNRHRISEPQDSTCSWDILFYCGPPENKKDLLTCMTFCLQQFWYAELSSYFQYNTFSNESTNLLQVFFGNTSTILFFVILFIFQIDH